MRGFFVNGVLGSLQLGMPVSNVFELLGGPPETGVNLTGKWRMAVYSERALQISYMDNLVRLIGIYFLSPDPPRLPSPLETEVPFSRQTTLPQFMEYLDFESIPWSQDHTFRDSVRLLAGKVIANFEDGRFRSLY
jgi:hypothetical protein